MKYIHEISNEDSISSAGEIINSFKKQCDFHILKLATESYTGQSTEFEDEGFKNVTRLSIKNVCEIVISGASTCY